MILIVDLDKYQKELCFKDGTKALLRPMVAEDMEALHEFFLVVPRGELRYLREDVSATSVVRSW